jgi:PhoPQ-activated pathogenicity-related protein
MGIDDILTEITDLKVFAKAQIESSDTKQKRLWATFLLRLINTEVKTITAKQLDRLEAELKTLKDSMGAK